MTGLPGTIQKQRTDQCRHSGMLGFRRLALLLAVGACLAACNAPVGPETNHQGTYVGQALVTNPNGGGPQVIVHAAPENSNSESR